MKKFLLAVAVSAVPAFGSHYMMCDTKVKVLDVKRVARLDGTAIFKNGNFTPGPAADHEQMMTIEVLETSNVEGHSATCLRTGIQETLMVRKELINQFKKGDSLKLKYRNIGDVSGSSITWEIIK